MYQTSTMIFPNPVQIRVLAIIRDSSQNSYGQGAYKIRSVTTGWTYTESGVIRGGPAGKSCREAADFQKAHIWH